MYIGIVLCFFLPAITEVPFDQRETTKVVREVIKAASQSYSWLAPVFHITTLLLVALLVTQGRRFGRIFYAYFAVVFALICLSNNIAVTERYGFVVILGNLVPMAIVSFLWVWEAREPRHDGALSRLPTWRYWVIPFAILAFGFPANHDGQLDLNPLLLLTSDYGVFFCPTAPVALAILSLLYPRVNGVLLGATSLVGTVFGVFNAMTLFLDPDYPVWMFILHIPLILVSVCGLLLPRLVRSPPGDARPLGIGCPQTAS